MNQSITFKEFKKAFKISAQDIFELFQEKIKSEIEKKFPEKSVVTKLSINNAKPDHVGNIHIQLIGEVQFGPEKSDIHGEIVWLTRLNSFRGHLTHSLIDSSAAFCLEKARIAFKKQEYEICLKYLDLITDQSLLSRKSVIKLRQISLQRFFEHSL